MIEETKYRGLYFLFNRLDQVEDIRNIEASAKAAWHDLINVHGEAEPNSGGFKFDPKATAWVSHSGCNIPTTVGAIESQAILSVSCKDVVLMARSILTTEQPGWKEIALLVPYT